MSNGIGRVWAVNAEGGDEGRPNGVGPVWIENADQLGSKLPEPEAGDTGKVLGVLNADGDIGWVPDQEGMAQVQADWDQSDSSQVSYIANKPSLATVATTGAYSDLSGTPTIPTVDQTYDASSANAQSGVAVASAVSGKQDTINDLSTIRSGAAAGATAVQPAALNDYATTAALTSGLSTKQDTISDLATIRSGAAAGATAVQPSSLATVATTGSYTDLLDKPTIPPGVVVDQVYDGTSTNAQSGTAVAGAISGVRQVPSTSSGDNGKVLGVTDSAGTLGWVAKGEADLFYVTYNVTTFDEIKTAYDAGKWPVLIDSHGHVSPMTDYGWIGTASSLQYAFFQNNSYVPYADTTGADYENEVYILELEIDPDMHRTETWSTTWNFSSADWNAVSGPRVIRNKPTIPSVDQTYNSASANAQSGAAVAQAIAAIPSASYTAGDGISIENDEISAKLGDGLEIGTSLSPVTVAAHALGYSDETYELGPSVVQQLDASLAHAVETTGLTLSIQNVIDNNNVNQPWVYNRPTDLKLYPTICRIGTDAGGPYADGSNALVLSTTGIDVSGGNGVIPAGTQFTYNLNDINTTLSTTDWATISANPANYTLSVGFSTQDGFFVTSVGSDAFTKNALYNSGTITMMEATLGAIAVSNPLPASTSSDAGKILTVNAQGAAAWGMLGSVTSIQQVNALPATPDANTLYLIPEA